MNLLKQIKGFTLMLTLLITATVKASGDPVVLQEVLTQEVPEGTLISVGEIDSTGSPLSDDQKIMLTQSINEGLEDGSISESIIHTEGHYIVEDPKRFFANGSVLTVLMSVGFTGEVGVKALNDHIRIGFEAGAHLFLVGTKAEPEVFAGPFIELRVGSKGAYLRSGVAARHVFYDRDEDPDRGSDFLDKKSSAYIEAGWVFGKDREGMYSSIGLRLWDTGVPQLRATVGKDF